MTTYGCVECHEETADPDERFILPFTHEMYCIKHMPKGAIQVTEFILCGQSWRKWALFRKVMAKSA